MSSPQRQRDRVYQLLLWIIHTDTLTELMWCCFSPNRLKVWFLLLVLNATLRSTGMFTARRMQRHVRVLSLLLVDLCVIRETCHRLKSKMFPSVFTSVFYHRVKKIEGFVFRSPASQLEFTKHFLLILFPPSAPAITHQPLTLLFLLDSLFFFFFFGYICYELFRFQGRGYWNNQNETSFIRLLMWCCWRWEHFAVCLFDYFFYCLNSITGAGTATNGGFVLTVERGNKWLAFIYLNKEDK